MITQSPLNYTLCGLFSAGLFFLAGQLTADIVNGEESGLIRSTEQSLIEVIKFIEPGSTNLLHFGTKAESAEATIVSPYSLSREKTLAARIPEPSQWPFLVFCMLVWGFVQSGRRGRPVRQAS